MRWSDTLILVAYLQALAKLVYPPFITWKMYDCALCNQSLCPFPPNYQHTLTFELNHLPLDKHLTTTYFKVAVSILINVSARVRVWSKWDLLGRPGHLSAHPMPFRSVARKRCSRHSLVLKAAGSDTLIYWVFIQWLKKKQSCLGSRPPSLRVRVRFLSDRKSCSLYICHLSLGQDLYKILLTTWHIYEFKNVCKKIILWLIIKYLLPFPVNTTWWIYLTSVNKKMNYI